MGNGPEAGGEPGRPFAPDTTGKSGEPSGLEAQPPAHRLNDRTSVASQQKSDGATQEARIRHRGDMAQPNALMAQQNAPFIRNSPHHTKPLAPRISVGLQTVGMAMAILADR
jgi:hypothetical protein